MSDTRPPLGRQRITPLRGGDWRRLFCCLESDSADLKVSPTVPCVAAVALLGTLPSGVTSAEAVRAACVSPAPSSSSGACLCLEAVMPAPNSQGPHGQATRWASLGSSRGSIWKRPLDFSLRTAVGCFQYVSRLPDPSSWTPRSGPTACSTNTWTGGREPTWSRANHGNSGSPYLRPTLHSSQGIY